VQTAGRLIRALGELPAELQDSHHAFERGYLQFGMILDGNTPAVVLNGYRTVVVDRHADGRGIFGHGFVDRVVDHLVNKMVQTAGSRIGDIHRRPLADMLKVAEVFELIGAVLLVAFVGLKLVAVQVRRSGVVFGVFFSGRSRGRVFRRTLRRAVDWFVFFRRTGHDCSLLSFCMLSETSSGHRP